MPNKLLVGLLILAAAIGLELARANDSSSATAFTSAQQVADLVPESAEIQTAGRWNPVGITQASQSVTSLALHRPATFHLKIQKFVPYHHDGYAYRMMAPDTNVIIHGCHVHCRIWIYFRADQNPVLAEVHKGAVLFFSGQLGRADIRMYDDSPSLSLDLVDVHIADNDVL